MTVWGICEKGNYREDNQDSILMRSEGGSGLFLVADGVGGSLDGAGASSYITYRYGLWWEGVFQSHREKDFFSFFIHIKETAEQINEELCRDCGVGNSCSTLALLFVHQGIFGYLSCGDSRIYRCGRDGVGVITRDDVWENRPDGDSESEHRGEIISAVGGYENLEYSCATDKLRSKDVFLLCSDGIYRYVEETQLLGSLRHMHRSLFLRESQVERLARKAVKGDTKDNYSLIVVKV